jgi:signal transduction histidine kinase
MKVIKRFGIFFTLFAGMVIVITILISYYFLNEIHTVFANAPNKNMAILMSNQIFLKAGVTYLLILLSVLAVSVPVGFYLSHIVSKPYLSVFERLSDIARERLVLSESNEGDLTKNQSVVLKKYLDILVADVKQLKDYEKAKSWKDGARLLMHELKNPLTPIKVAAQTIAVKPEMPPDQLKAEINSILTSTYDIENILMFFKELVNIDFGQKVLFDFKVFWTDFCVQNQSNIALCKLAESLVSQSMQVISEQTLLRMVLINLINNGLEANRDNFHVDLKEDGKCIHIAFLTYHVSVENPAHLFKPGYSSKGKQRGLGLFLCKTISDYLDLHLSFDQDSERVCFSVTLNIV